MGLYEFIALPQDERAKMIWNQGVYLAMLPYQNGSVNLYGLDSFYVEVYYHESANRIEDIRSFRAVACLEPYLEAMDLGSLE
ncbi:MAG: hypothetical protein OEQ53_09750 [Saprospiraceae bacterium]|nr:hypothetical protein [Saprospiraceae bacterium]